MVQWFEISTAPLWAQLDDWRLSRLPSFKPKVNLSGRRGTYILELQPRKETSQADSVSLRAHWCLLICLILRWSTRKTLRTETKAAAIWQQIPYQSLASRPSCFYAGAKPVLSQGMWQLLACSSVSQVQLRSRRLLYLAVCSRKTFFEVVLKFCHSTPKQQYAKI